MLGKALVQERIVRAQQIEHASVLANHAVDKKLGLLPERLPKVIVKIREETHVRRNRVEIAQVQPLRREVGDEVLRTRVRQHPFDLPLENGGLVEIAAGGNVQQFVIWNAAPQEK